MVCSLGHDDREPGVQVEVDMAVKEPRSSIVRFETDSNVIRSCSDIHNITTNGVHIVVGVTSSGANDIERVLKYTIRVSGHSEQSRELPTPCKGKGCGAPGALVAFMGKEIWMDELAGRE